MSEKIPYLNSWKNLGDIDFLAFGGCAVRSHYGEDFLKVNPEMADTYDVFYYDPTCFGDDETMCGSNNEDGKAPDKVMAYLCTVQVSGYEKDKDDILYLIGMEDRKDEDMLDIMPADMWAKEIVESHYVDNAETRHSLSPDNEDFYVTSTEAFSWMKEIGVADDLGLESIPIGADEEGLEEDEENIDL